MAARAIAIAGALAAVLLSACGSMATAALRHGSVAGAARQADAARYASAAAGADGASQWNHIAAGAYFSCGIQLGNTLWCWGANHYGQLGIGNKQYPNQPQQVSRPATAGWASVTAGGFHGCATRKDSTLWCWGDNDAGQLGIGSLLSQLRPQQVTIPAATGWSSVSAGGAETCATRTDASLWCWGSNDAGQLGNGATTGQDLPQQVTTPAATGWASITVGGESACATRSDATLWCWGYNGFGELGIGTTIGQDLPQQVTIPAAAGWASATAGFGHTCATRSDATLWCWGFNDAGQLGNGTKTDQDLPQQVTTPAAAGWTSVTAGGQQTCATRTYALWCWGFNRYGQLGIGSNTNQARPRRVPLPSRTGWSLMSAGAFHTCATHTGHTLWCWGYNGYGQLGIGNSTSQNLPQQISP